MLNCIAIDDEPLALDLLSAFCSRIPQLDLKRTFTSTPEAAKYIRNFPVDLVFLDIQMPDENGLDFCRRHCDGKLVIFTTAFSEFALEGFNVSALDYLLKPISFSRFEQACQKALDYHAYLQGSAQRPARSLFVRSEYSLVKIAFSEIEYIETLDDYLKIHLSGKKTVLTKMNLKNMMDKLDPNEFVRVHRSYIVPLSRILGFRNRTVLLGSIEIPVGVRFEKDFLRAYKG